MRFALPSPILPLAAAVLIAGCTETATSRYPSLLPRPIESQSLDEPDRPVPVAAPDPALDAQVVKQLQALDKAEAGFKAAAQTAEASIAVARGLPEGSEPWLEAQAALSTLGAARQPADAVLAELERLAIGRGAAGQPPYPALDAGISRAETVSAAQATRSAGLEAALAGN